MPGFFVFEVCYTIKVESGYGVPAALEEYLIEILQPPANILGRRAIAGEPVTVAEARQDS